MIHHRRPLLLCALTLSAATAPLHAQEEPADEVDQFAAMDIRTGGSGLVVGLVHENELDFLEAWGTVARDSEEPLTPTHLLTYPDLVPALLAVTARALATNGSLDADAPLASYLGQGLSPALADVTLVQLLAHRAGLDDAAAGADFPWESILTELPAGAKLLDPGTAFSWSRYSYPAVAAVLVRATGLPLEDLLSRALFEPLGMARTTFDVRRAGEMGLVAGYVRDASGQEVRAPVPARVGGLPVLFTAAPDVIQFATAWASGGIAGADPVAGVEALGDGGEVYRDGVWVDRFRGAPRASLSSEVAGFGTELRLMPESGSILFSWKNGRRAGLTTGWVQNRLATVLGLPEEPEEDTPPGLPEAGAEGERPLPDPAEWAGTYRNGDRMIQLREREDGTLAVFVGEGDMALRWVGPETLQALTPQGEGTSLIFELRETGGTRLLIMNRLAYLREGGAG